NYYMVNKTTAEDKPGKEIKVRQAICDVARAARAQLGCIEYTVLRSAENPAITVNFERWVSKANRDIFLAGADVKEFASAVSVAFVESPQPVSYEILDSA